MLRRGWLLMLICLALAAPAAAQRDPSFNLVNRTGLTITEVYASPSSYGRWLHDRLGSEVIPPGRTHPIRIIRGECLYDLRIVMQGGLMEERRGLDLCRATQVVFGPPGAAPQGFKRGA